MTDQKKKEYNKEHYLKNRNATLERMRSHYENKKKTSENIVSLFEAEAQPVESKREEKFESKVERKSEHKIRKTPLPPSPKRSDRRLSLGEFCLIVLAGANSYFLIAELAHYFAFSDALGSTNAFQAYLKALILEGGVAALWVLIHAKTRFGSVARRMLILIIYAYSIWAISHSAIQNAYSAKTQNEFTRQKIVELESEISKKVSLRDAYFSQNRVTLGARIDGQISDLRQALEKCRTILVQFPNMGLIWNTLLSVILFRAVAMITNLACLGELARRYRLKTSLA